MPFRSSIRAHAWIRMKNSEPFWQKVFFCLFLFFSGKTTTKTGRHRVPVVQRGSTHGRVNYSPCCRRLRWKLRGHRQTSLWEALPLTERPRCLSETRSDRKDEEVQTSQESGALLEKGWLRRTPGCYSSPGRDIKKDKISSRALRGVREQTAGDDVIFIFVLLLCEMAQIPESARCAWY